jgi:hypothetical protein
MKKWFAVALMILGVSCAKNTPLANSVENGVECVPIYGRKNDWVVISDDLARNIYRHNMICAEINK